MMKNFLNLLLAGVFALGIAACDNVVLPGGPGDGRNPGDSTGTGGGGRDTTGGGGGDTTNPGGVLVFTGMFVDMMGVPTTAPEDASIYVVWDRGDGDLYVLGQGEIIRNSAGMFGDAYTVAIDATVFPEAALFDPDGSGGVHGIGKVILAGGPQADHTVLTPTPGVPPLGELMSAEIIYYTGREKATPWTMGWIDNFDVGLSLAQVAFHGWVPYNGGSLDMVVFGR